MMRFIFGRKPNDVVYMPVDPDYFAAACGLDGDDCRENLIGIVDQLNAEMMGMA
jgi:hypothetical protein